MNISRRTFIGLAAALSASAVFGHQKKRIIAVDCETDPFRYGRIPFPFIWGAFDGENYYIFHSTDEFVAWLKKQNCVAYAHNGGKFDYIYLLPYLEGENKIRMIGGRMAELKIGRATLRDSYSIVPVPLKEIQKDEIDYRLMEADIRADHLPEIIDYLKTDVRVLWLLVTTFRREAGVSITIAANAMASAKRLGIDPGRTNVRFDRRFRPFYYGGRTECFSPGTHENISVYDIRSSYPFAMSQDHPTGDAQEPFHNDLNEEEFGRCFLTVKCYSAGAFPIRDEKTRSISFPHAFGQYNVTGWEYLIAKKHGLIKNARIISGERFTHSINFAGYVKKWYEHKERHRPRSTVEEKAQYTIGKILMNSLYGKLSMNPLRYFDYKFCEPGTPVDNDNGWEEYTSFQGQEIHRRSVVWDLQYKYGKAWEKKPIFYNVATGASTTGLARANLLDAIHIAGPERAIYCDTDSIVMRGFERPAGLDMSERLGAWNCEGEFGIGHFAGKKLYAMRSRDQVRNEKTKKMEWKYKVACKGSKLEFDHLWKIVRGETITWQNPAPTFSIARAGDLANALDAEKYFVNRRIRATSLIGAIH